MLFDEQRASGVRTATGEAIAAREVFVSAGAIRSPAILLRFGVGLGDGLRVGAGLKDHAAKPGFEIAFNQAGRMRSPNEPVFTSMLRYTSGLEEAGPNDMQIVWFGAVGRPDDALEGGRLMGAVMRVSSHGEGRLRSDDPLVDPVVQFRMLSDNRDRTRLRECVRRMIDVARHPAVASVSDRVLALTTPIDELDSGEAIDA